jgi:hypothetical protein
MLFSAQEYLPKGYSGLYVSIPSFSERSMKLSRIVRSSSPIVALGACLATTAAQSPGNQISTEALRAACSDDAARLCAGVQPGGGRIIACLQQHQDALSNQCRQAAGLPPKSSAAAPSQPPPSSPCSDDAARLCAGVQPGGGRIIACLKQHQDELSDACRKAGGLPPRSNAIQPDTTALGPTYAPPAAGSNALAEAASLPANADTPAAIGQPTHVAGEVFVRRPIVDPAHGNMTVATLHVPQKWTFASKVEWHYDWIENPLIVSSQAANPSNSEAFYQYPLLRLESINVAPQYRQYVKGPQARPGQRMTTGAISMPLQQPIPAMTMFIKQARPNANIKWVGTQELPSLAQALNLSPWPNDHGIAVKISYELNGQTVDEAFFGVYYYTKAGNSAVSVGQVKGPADVVQQTNWGFRGLMSFRAPAGTLERRMPVFALIAKSCATNPQWMQLDKSINDQILASFNQKLQQGYDQLRAAQAVMSQVQAQEKEFNKGIDKFDQNLRTASFDDSWLRTTGGGASGSGGHLSSTDRTSNLLRGEDTVQDPTSSTGTTQLSNAGDYHYTNGLGDYRTYSDPNMTPEKAGESGSWTPMTTVQ